MIVTLKFHKFKEVENCSFDRLLIFSLFFLMLSSYFVQILKADILQLDVVWLFDDFEGGGELTENVPSESYYNTSNSNSRIVDITGDKDDEISQKDCFSGKDRIDNITDNANCEVHLKNEKCYNGDSEVVTLVVNSSEVEVEEIFQLQKPVDSLHSFSWKNLQDMIIMKQKIRMN